MTDYFMSTIRPGLLVNMRTSITGDGRTVRRDVECKMDGAAEIKEWNTKRTLFNAEEHARAVKVRTKVRTFITSICIESNHGLLCPIDKVDAFEKAVKDARKTAKEFNATARYSYIGFSIIAGKIAADDVEAFRSIGGEMRSLLKAMDEGLTKLKPDNVREKINGARKAADMARKLAQMLPPEAQAEVMESVNATRKAARQLVKSGEEAALEVEAEVLATIRKSSTMFLDLDEVGEFKKPVAHGVAVDYEPEAKPAAPAKAKVVEFDNDEPVATAPRVKAKVPKIDVDADDEPKAPKRKATKAKAKRELVDA